MFEGFRSLFTGALRDREDVTMKDGEVVRPHPRWTIFNVRRSGRTFRVGFQEIAPVDGKQAVRVDDCAEVVEELAGLVGNDKPIKPEKD